MCKLVQLVTNYVGCDDLTDAQVGLRYHFVEGRVRLAYTPYKDLARRPFTAAEVLAAEERIREWVSTRQECCWEWAVYEKLICFLAEQETLELWMAPQIQHGYFDASIEDVEHRYPGLRLCQECGTAPTPSDNSGGRPPKNPEAVVYAAIFRALLSNLRDGAIPRNLSGNKLIGDVQNILEDTGHPLEASRLKDYVNPLLTLLKSGR